MKCSLSKDSEIDKIQEAQGKMSILISKLQRTDFNAIVKYVFSLGQPATFLQSRKVKRNQIFLNNKNINKNRFLFYTVSVEISILSSF